MLPTAQLHLDSHGSAVIKGCICRTWLHLYIFLRPGTSPTPCRGSCSSSTAVPRNAEVNPGGTGKITWKQSSTCSGKSTRFSEGCYLESQDAATVWLLQKKHPKIVSVLWRFWSCFIQSRFKSALLISCMHS